MFFVITFGFFIEKFTTGVYMSVLEEISSVKGFRECRDETIPRKIMGRVLEAGRNTPSPGGVNSIEFVVIEDQDTLDSVGDITGDSRVPESSAAVVIVGDLERMDRKTGDSSFEYCFAEASVAAQNIRIEASSHDLCSIWVSGFDYEMLKEKIDVPDGKLPLAVVGLGFSDEPIDIDSKWGMNEICFYENYGNQVGSNFDSIEWSGVKEEKRVVSKKLKVFFEGLGRKVRKVL